jgi:hypothetical protein
MVTLMSIQAALLITRLVYQVVHPLIARRLDGVPRAVDFEWNCGEAIVEEPAPKAEPLLDVDLDDLVLVDDNAPEVEMEEEEEEEKPIIYDMLRETSRVDEACADDADADEVELYLRRQLLRERGGVELSLAHVHADVDAAPPLIEDPDDAQQYEQYADGDDGGVPEELGEPPGEGEEETQGEYMYVY